MQVNQRAPFVADDEDVLAMDQLLSDHAPEAKKVHAPPPVHSYRPDIDGLRTLAVVPVLVFHAYPTLFPGGFIGVDIFFVISGFLISGILFKEHTRGKFTYASFYERRVRRIFPTFIIVLSATLWLGYLYLMAPKLQAMAATIFAGTLFSANLQVLSLEKAYFDLGNNPVLHLWSLGVEEQFYILWPCFCAIIMKLSYKRAIFFQVAFMALSFGINIAFLGYRDNKVSFYMPLCRFWQMSMGGLLSYVATQAASSLEPPAAPVSSGGYTSAAGLGLILLGFAAIDEHRAFPGFWAFLPTAGATLLIAAGPTAPFNRYVLGNAAVVYIGKISYCLYLWHWPLLVITKDRYPLAATRPFFAEPWVVLVISFALSVATYEDVEMRLRRSKNKLITPVLVLGVVCIALFSAAVHANPADYSMIEIGLKHAAPPALVDAPVLVNNASTGIPDIIAPSLSQAQQAMRDYGWNEGMGDELPYSSPYVTNLIRPAGYGHQVKYFPGEVKVINPGHEKDNGLLIVLGDSHADMSKPRFVKLFEDATANNDDKFPTIVVNSYSARPLLSCRAEFFATLAMVHAVKPQAVLLIVHYFQYMHPGGPSDRPRNAIPACCYDDYLPCDEQNMDDVNAMWVSLQEELTKLTEMGIKVFVVNQSPEYEHMNPWAWISGETVTLPTPFRKSVFNRDFEWLLDPLHATVKAANATLIDYADNYSNGDEITLTDAQGYPVFAFTQHFTAHFSRNYLTVVDQVVDAARLP
ncbi:hypothetical protein SDRG_00555 [Saprolegnia diclina VS20]|uniref:Acyltransferase 3 domain-containing protein n=1 Tax=Saprolegnia diclina (strain VS20) TaxID=1156394 RepID=T0R7B3_SAPDV|nr:hypothetical protein SDRG_00555 [Saprolegnia diclina VS20]EQC42836.1 hypothetical protein SDRG_00555 [Saprolegnia diclina VS20]|eukprot:XP_008604259.1 hypothetical protein SDRG_00555 [Saprolegnia diclina VS20]